MLEAAVRMILTAACDLCRRPFDRPDRAGLRRSLRRHLMAHHAHNEPDATARALALVQPAAGALTVPSATCKLAIDRK